MDRFRDEDDEISTFFFLVCGTRESYVKMEFFYIELQLLLFERKGIEELNDRLKSIRLVSRFLKIKKSCFEMNFKQTKSTQHSRIGNLDVEYSKLSINIIY